MRQRPVSSALPGLAPGSGMQRPPDTRPPPDGIQEAVDANKLRITSDAVFKALVAVPLLMWWAALIAGMLQHDGVPVKYRGIQHPLQWFDSLFFKPLGNLIPFLMLGLRSAFASLPNEDSKGRVLPKVDAFVGRTATMSSRCVVLYAILAFLRISIYLAHIAFHNYGELPHMVSDHMTLAACVVASLHLELLCCLSDILRFQAATRSTGWGVSTKEGGLAAGLVLNALLCLLVSADMYYTALYYHKPVESMASAVLGFVLFHLPVLAMIRAHKR